MYTLVVVHKTGPVSRSEYEDCRLALMSMNVYKDVMAGRGNKSTIKSVHIEG